jgi:Spy/CpxP family protein refolding chaperone
MKSRMLSAGMLAVALCATGMAYGQTSETTATAATTTGTAAGAQDGPGGFHNGERDGERGGWEGHRHMGMGFLSRKLNLTEAQRAQIKTIFEAQKATTRPVVEQMEQNRAAMLTATASGAFDQAKVQSIAAQQAQLAAKLMVQKQAVEAQIYNTVLTTEQKATADQMRQKELTRINERVERMAGTEAPAAQQ